MDEIVYVWGKYIAPWLVEHGIKILIIIVGVYLLNYFSRRFVKRIVRVTVARDKSVSTEAENKREDTLVRVFTWTIRVLLFVLGVIMVIDEIGVSVGPILAGAGIVGLAVGFGGQYLIRDIISGFFIILENQYRIGDVINVNDTSGLVEDISLRMTTLRDMDGTVHFIPHGEIKKVSNLSKIFARVNLNINIGYSSNLERVIDVVNKIGQEMADDPQWKDSLLTPPQFLRINDFVDSAMVIKIVADTKPLKQWDITAELRKRLKIAFDREGIEIPFPQRVIHTV